MADSSNNSAKQNAEHQVGRWEKDFLRQLMTTRMALRHRGTELHHVHVDKEQPQLQAESVAAVPGMPYAGHGVCDIKSHNHVHKGTAHAIGNAAGQGAAAGAISQLLNPATWKEFENTRKSVGLKAAISGLIARIGVSTCMGTTFSMFRSAILEGVEEMLKRAHVTPGTNFGINLCNGLKAAGVGVILTAVWKLGLFLFYSYKKHASKNDNERAAYDLKMQSLVGADTLLLDAIGIILGSVLAVFMPGSIFGVIAMAVIVQVALYVVGLVIDKKNEAGGWTEFVRPVFAAMGIMSTNPRVNKTWDTSVDTDEGIPEDLLCPITRQMFVFPVVTKYGQVYERRAIEAWLVHGSTCPATRAPLTMADLRPCPEMLRLVDKYAAHHKFVLVD